MTTQNGNLRNTPRLAAVAALAFAIGAFVASPTQVSGTQQAQGIAPASVIQPQTGPAAAQAAGPAVADDFVVYEYH